MKGLRVLIDKNVKLLQPTNIIVLIGIPYWNMSEAHINVMLRLLKHASVQVKFDHPAKKKSIRLLFIFVDNALFHQRCWLLIRVI